MFSKTKASLRNVAARTVDTVITAMGKALELVTLYLFSVSSSN